MGRGAVAHIHCTGRLVTGPDQSPCMFAKRLGAGFGVPLGSPVSRSLLVCFQGSAVIR